MKSTVRLMEELLLWGSTICCACTTVDQDIKTLNSRYLKEGDRFITITLPQFAKDLEQALSNGGICEQSFAGFGRKDGAPRFLGDHLRQIFSSNGTIRTDISPQEQARHIGVIRQICLFASKVEIPSTQVQVDACIKGYVDTDIAIPDTIPNLDAFRRAAKRYLGSYFEDVARVVLSSDFRPGHASGALATRESYNARFDSNVWTERLQTWLPYWDVLACNWRDSSSQEFSVLSEHEEVPAKVTTVPKNAKGPRIIAMEPVHNQYVQQGILRAMTEVLLRPKYQRLYKEVCWMDQEYNRGLARVGSVDGSFATLDLSEASDRVGLELVRNLPLGSYLEGVILAARSTHASLPSGEVMKLRKFASMGSSLCFPMETFAFYTIARMSAESAAVYVPPQRGAGLPALRVYGDDIIVPVDSAQSLIKLLESFGLKVNTSKSFYGGNFRESCGADWFAGFSVSVTRIRRLLPSELDHYDAITSAIELHNRLYELGASGACKVIRDTLDSIEGLFVPRIPVDCVGLGFHSEEGQWSRLRFNRQLYRLESRALIRKEQKPVDELDGYGALRKFFANRGNLPRDADHLHSDGRSRCVSMNIGWAAAR